MILINFMIPFKIGDIYRFSLTKFVEEKKLILIILFERALDIIYILIILYIGILLF